MTDDTARALAHLRMKKLQLEGARRFDDLIAAVRRAATEDDVVREVAAEFGCAEDEVPALIDVRIRTLGRKEEIGRLELEIADYEQYLAGSSSSES